MKLLRTLDQVIEPAHTALIIIDAQRDFCSPEGAMPKKMGLDLTRINAAMPRLNRFIKDCRDYGIKIIYVKQMFALDKMLPNIKALKLDENDQIWYVGANTEGAEFCDQLEPPRKDETIITKWSYDAFYDTDLHLLLQSCGIKSLLMTGFVTNICVESTARHGFFLGYHIVLVSDCADSYTKAEHDSSIQNIESCFGHVAESQEINKILQTKGV